MNFVRYQGDNYYKDILACFNVRVIHMVMELILKRGIGSMKILASEECYGGFAFSLKDMNRIILLLSYYT